MKKQLREQKGKIMNKDRKATDLEQLREDLLGACARGYTHDENSSKELDSDLIKAMVEELMPIFQSNRKAILEEVRSKVIGRNVGDRLNLIGKDGRTYNEYSVYGKDKQILINEFKEEMRQKLSLLEGKK